ncbi:holo-ACP synthase [Aestuariimicrobium ganziense]|uniref:holo-ACP synthase n=1 Tax=Aestuariimicrobium ganziense TaxID=2773677 RepID=UPI001940AB02|nr:holo-ACP synthase [Aestuariimicrobium ganziense]
MIVGIGMDVCSVERYERMVERHPGVVARLLNPSERQVPIASQAARFAAKEALAKALGAPAGMVWLDSEVVRAGHGQPSFELRGTVAARADELGITRVHLSISHDAGLACAYVVCEG